MRRRVEEVHLLPGDTISFEAKPTNNGYIDVTTDGEKTHRIYLHGRPNLVLTSEWPCPRPWLHRATPWELVRLGIGRWMRNHAG